MRDKGLPEQKQPDVQVGFLLLPSAHETGDRQLPVREEQAAADTTDAPSHPDWRVVKRGKDGAHDEYSRASNAHTMFTGLYRTLAGSERDGCECPRRAGRYRRPGPGSCAGPLSCHWTHAQISCAFLPNANCHSERLVLRPPTNRQAMVWARE